MRGVGGNDADDKFSSSRRSVRARQRYVSQEARSVAKVQRKKFTHKRDFFGHAMLTTVENEAGSGS
jgi:hypothetical protein